ncbi:hypothetical protein DYH09_11080 [bacterium CPR1]|nr:hypothetical protein [bacterium CPR1]
MTFCCKLELPRHPHSPPLARALVEQLSSLAGLPDLELAQACQEAVENALRYAPGEVRLEAELSALDLVLCVVDQGAPMEGAPQTSKGHGLERIARAVDELRWVSLGRQGKELLLRRRRPHPEVGQLESLERFPDQIPLAPEQEYEVRPFQPRDALGVARLCYQVYGYTYMHEELYFPDRVTALNASGQLYSMVALDAAGQVVGHYALERPQPGPLAECGEALVSPMHRGRRLMERMGQQLETVAPDLGLTTLYSNAVTLHPYSQKAAEAFGRTPCGLTLSGVPAQVTFKGLGGGQRTSCVLYVQNLTRPPARPVYLPDRYRDLLLQLYGHLGDHQVNAQEASAFSGAGALTVELKPYFQTGRIRVTRSGEDSPTALSQALRDLCQLGQAQAVYLELSLGDPATPELTLRARELGFFFSALGPQDWLRLQWIAQPVDLGALKLNSDQAKALRDFIQADRSAGPETQ